MIRISVIVLLLVLAGCADQSKGAALGECRTKYYLDGSATQAQLVPDCMKAKSFEMTAACRPDTDEDEWDWQVQSFTYDNPRCYRPIGSAAWIATVLSPL